MDLNNFNLMVPCREIILMIPSTSLCLGLLARIGVLLYGFVSIEMLIESLIFSAPYLHWGKPRLRKKNFNRHYLCFFFSISYVWPLVRIVSKRSNIGFIEERGFTEIKIRILYGVWPLSRLKFASGYGTDFTTTKKTFKISVFEKLAGRTCIALLEQPANWLFDKLVNVSI